jgi:hypothetical protein
MNNNISLKDNYINSMQTPKCKILDGSINNLTSDIDKSNLDNKLVNEHRENIKDNINTNFTINNGKSVQYPIDENQINSNLIVNPRISHVSSQINYNTIINPTELEKDLQNKNDLNLIINSNQNDVLKYN